jgi:hypothetical protein
MPGVNGKGVHPIDATPSRACVIPSRSTYFDRRAVTRSSNRMLDTRGSISSLFIEETTFSACELRTSPLS